MPTYRIRAQWFGPNGKMVGVADDTVCAVDACDALEFATPSPYTMGDFTGATIQIDKISDADPPKDDDE